jgi:hypothetical protein
LWENTKNFIDADQCSQVVQRSRFFSTKRADEFSIVGYALDGLNLKLSD